MLVIWVTVNFQNRSSCLRGPNFRTHPKKKKGGLEETLVIRVGVPPGTPEKLHENYKILFLTRMALLFCSRNEVTR